VTAGRARPARLAGPAALLASLLLAGPASAQVFLASRPAPPFEVGPLVLRAAVGPALGPTELELLWSLVVTPGASPDAVSQDLFLLWPGAVRGAPGLGEPDRELARYLESRGLAVIDEGRVPLLSQALQELSGARPAEALPGGAPFATFVTVGGPLGLSAPATYVRIPWHPRLPSRDWLMTLRLTVPDLVRPKTAGWLERVFAGRRHVLALGFHDVRSRAVFPLYLEHRDRVVRLADQPSELVVDFGAASRLKIDAVSPATSVRRASETREDTEVVSHFLDPSEGLNAQLLTVQFTYFSGVQAWAPVLIPTLFFVLGNLAGVLVRTVGERVGRVLAGRVRFGPPGPEGGRLQTGVLVPRDVLARLVPGATTYGEVVRLLGPEAEQRETLGAPPRRALVYRGRRVVPHGRRMLRWLTTVHEWDVEEHTVEVAFDGDRLSDVKAEVRRTRRSAAARPAATPDPSA
jgi:hypothetical protein